MKNTDFLSLEEITDIMHEVVVQFLIPHFLELGMEASGNWRENLMVGADPNVGYIQGTRYTEQLVYGRRPGTYAPIEPLKQWAMIKLGLNEQQARGAAFAISKKLHDEGSEYYKQGGTDLLEILKSPKVIDFINQKQKNYIEKQIELEINRYIVQKFK